MQILLNQVLLLKSEKEDSEDKFETKLHENGFHTSFLKTLEFQFKNLEELQEKLSRPGEYEGLIFVTPRTVRGVRIASDVNLGTMHKWNEKVNYAIGETTNNLVIKELGLQYCLGQESGNASNLADIILQGKEKISKPFLYPCGNIKGDILINKLKEQDIEVDVIIVYETVSSLSLHKDFMNLTNNFTEIPEYWVYFSPSGVKSTIPLFGNLPEGACSRIKFIAIGPTTNDALLQNNIKVKSVSRRPTPEDLVSAILS